MSIPEIELERQALRPGEVLRGRVVGVPGAGSGWSLTLQGEEILSANSIALNYILPVVEDVRKIDGEQSQDFEFTMPAHAPPTYASQDLRCQYFLKLHKAGFLGRKIRRMHLTVLPPEPAEEPEPHFMSLEAGPVKVEVQLDRTNVRTGQSLTGELLIHRDTAGPLPKRLSFRFAAIEEAVEPGYHHRKVLWLMTHDVEPEEDMAYPLRGVFEFPIPEDAPFCGEWMAFRVHYGFRVGVTLADGKDARKSLPVQVDRHYVPIETPSSNGNSNATQM